MAELTPEQMQLLLDLGMYDSRTGQLNNQLQQAQGLRTFQPVQHSSPLAALVGGLGDAAAIGSSYVQEKNLRDQQQALDANQQRGRSLGANMVSQTPDISALLDPALSPEQQNAALKAFNENIAKRQQVASLFGLTGDKVLAPMGQQTVTQNQKLQDEAYKAPQTRAETQLKRSLAAKADAVAAGGGLAGLTPESVIALRPEVAAALGGDEAVLMLTPAQLAAAVKAYDQKAGMDYKNNALDKRLQQQANRTNFLERSIGVREKKLGLDIAGRNVPGMEMQEGYVLQPKEAAKAQTLRGNVARATQALQALRSDFAQYGPDRLASMGGLIPSEALTRMEGNRARAMEAAMLLQGMNPTIGHQALLEAQLRDPANFKNLNHAAYLAQIDELQKAIDEAERSFAAGHGVKTLRKLQTPAEPDAATKAPAAAPAVSLKSRIAELKASGMTDPAAIAAKLKEEGLVQ